MILAYCEIAQNKAKGHNEDYFESKIECPAIYSKKCSKFE